MSTDRFDTPSGAASGKFHGGCVSDEWGDLSHRLARTKVAETKMWRPFSTRTAAVAASALRLEYGGTHNEHRPVRHAERRGEWKISC